MSVTVTVKKKGVAGDLRYVAADITFDSSYPTGGEALTAANLGVHGGTVQLALAAPAGGLAFEYDYTNSKLKAYEQGFTTGSTAAADSTSGAKAEDFAGSETVFVAMGTAIDTTYRVGALPQVASTTDLSAVTVRLLAFITGV